MSDEKKDLSTTADANAEAEKDVLDVLAELKAEQAQKEAEDEDSTKVDEKGCAQDEKALKTNGAIAAGEEDTEEARVIAAVADLARESEAREESQDGSRRPERGSRQPRANYRENIKSDLTSQQESSDPDAIRKQVEFYFSDSNLPMDKFLLSKVGGSSNHPVELSVIHSFKRMRHFQPFSAIVDALRTSEALELTDNDTKVRRRLPLPESVNENPDPAIIKTFEDKSLSRSIYAKGFGEEKPSTQFDIEAFFAPYGPTNAIRLRRTYDKVFKGSVFVEFDSEETQQKFLDLDPKPKWKGQELLIKSKNDYCGEKIKEIEAGRIQPNRGRGGFRGRGGRDGDRNRDWRERRAEDQKKGFERGSRDHRNRRGRGNSRVVQKDARGVPVVQSTVARDETPSAAAGQKRPRESESLDHPAKKVDVKEG